ncbi:MAG: DeoR family transcriptional regulator [Chloroflexi bacterium]|nr:MAG: DeoR family transcriptional regulator [Chloroflexota bacterium]
MPAAEDFLAEAHKRHGVGHTTSRSKLVLPEKRRQRLAEMIRSEGEIRLHTAARVLGVSEMTARRDLELLQITGRGQAGTWWGSRRPAVRVLRPR